jgi:hypothetical protein
MTNAEFRLRELHALLLHEVDRNAHDNAVRLLKQLRKEPCSRETRMQGWQSLYDRAKSLRNIDRQIECLEAMRTEDAQRGVAA